MPEYVLDTSGQVCRTEVRDYGTISRCTLWRDLDAFTQGYIEAMFFTAEQPERDLWAEMGTDGSEFDRAVGECGFADLAPETLASILADCAKFQAGAEWKAVQINLCWAPLSKITDPDCQAGRDFWYTRNGHGVGFWDGDWPEPYASALTDAAHAFGEVWAYLGDDGKVYLS